MAYFLNKKVNDESPVSQALVRVVGVGPFLANTFCKKIGIRPTLKLRDLTSKQVALLADIVVKDKVNLKQEELIRDLYDNVVKLTQIRSYRGMRHKKGLPLRGQRTRTNSKTAKRRNKIYSRSR
jgi:small subunit ribosomal protein S13